MRISLQPQQGVPQMPGVVSIKVQSGILAAQPSREQKYCHGESVHFGEKRDDERRERPEGPPVATRSGMREAERKQNENQRIEDHQAPKPVSTPLMSHTA